MKTLTSARNRRLLIMAAGTGGHIFPGLAIAETMRARGWEVTWLGTRHGMEQRLVTQHGITLDSIDFSGMRGKGMRHTLAGIGKLVAGLAGCLRILRRRAPDVVLGMGGYVTVPGGLMARLCGIPLVLVNADAALLLSNRVLTPLAQRVLFGLPAVSGRTAGKAVVTGNPVRADILALPLPALRYAGRTGVLQVLVLGGSLGAARLNACVPAALALLAPHSRPQVIHQSGKGHAVALRAAYAAVGVEAEVVEFIDDMAHCYAVADLVICRAGAITVAELTAAGIASILVPFVARTTSHQRDNATWMAAQKAALHLAQTELTPAHLASLLGSLTRSGCETMAQAAHCQGRRDATGAIAAVLEDSVKAGHCLPPQPKHQTQPDNEAHK